MRIVKAVVRAAISFGIILVMSAGLLRAQRVSTNARTSRSRASAEQQELKQQIRELKEGQAEIRKELLEIKKLLLAREAGPPKPSLPEKISIAERPARGNDSARVVIVEFSDFQCPFCGRFFRDAWPQIDQEYIKTGKIKYVFKHVPLEQIHPAALKAAEAAECASEQGRFWEMHDRLFNNQSALSSTNIAFYAQAIGLDTTKFSQCLDTGKNVAAIRRSQVEADELGVQGTPTFFIGVVDAKNPGAANVMVLSFISGAQPFAVFKSAIEKALATN